MYHDVYQKSESELGDPTRGISLITGYQGIEEYKWYTCTFMCIPRFIWQKIMRPTFFCLIVSGGHFFFNF